MVISALGAIVDVSLELEHVGPAAGLVAEFERHDRVQDHVLGLAERRLHRRQALVEPVDVIRGKRGHVRSLTPVS